MLFCNYCNVQFYFVGNRNSGKLPLEERECEGYDLRTSKLMCHSFILREKQAFVVAAAHSTLGSKSFCIHQLIESD